MPKLTKIRLSGCKYDGLRKEHENSIFDLTKDGQADHTLFTLCNGGGKGVMMQLLFQLLLPETRWGKNNGNKIISMFYDQRNNLYPFTFHVVLEWVLDTLPEKKLITGIVMKATIKNTSTEEDEKTGLSYFLYTHEYEKSSNHTIESLPIYNKKTNQVVDIDDFEKFIQEFKGDFRRYSQTSVKRKDAEYYRYLESMGIYRSEWNNLKAINRSEGGSSDYFIGASDNKSIFDKIIIPAIHENIRQYTYDNQDSLMEMFKSNLSITKDLPLLMKREGDYKDLLVEIKPLIENAKSGSGFYEIKNRLQDKGNDIYFILKEEENTANEEVEKWNLEEKKALKERDELDFKKDNLHYNKKRKELQEKEEENKSLQALYEKENKELENKENELLTFQINEILYHKKEKEQKLKSKINEKERLIEVLDLTDIKSKAEELNNEIQIEWEQVKKHWTDCENQYHGYMNYTNQLLEENKHKKSQYKMLAAQLQNEINKFGLKEENLETYRKKLSEIYDPFSIEFPERIMEDLLKAQENTKNKIVNGTNEKAAFEQKSAILKDFINKNTYKIESKTKEIELLTEKIKKAEEYERNLVRRISKQLMENYDGGMLNHNWYANKLEALEALEVNKKTKLEDTLRMIWEKNIEKALNKEEYFIPNKDILLLKQEILKMGIHVETGAEYLKNLEQEEKQALIHNYPGFLYAVVIGNLKQWETIDKNINKDLFLTNMVPVYIRSEMNSNKDEIFKIIVGEAYELLEASKFSLWKDSTENEINSLLTTESNIKEDLKNIQSLKQDLNAIAKNDIEYTLSKALRELENEGADLLEETRSKEEEKSNIDYKLEQTQARLLENEDQLLKINKQIPPVEDYINEKQEVETQRKLILKTKQKLGEINKDISTVNEDSESIRYDQDLIKDAFNRWDLEITKIGKDIETIINEKYVKNEINSNYANWKTPDFSLHADFLTSLMSQRKIIDEDISKKNQKISTIEVEIKYEKEAIEGFIASLDKLDKEWYKYEYLDLTITAVNIKIDELNRMIPKIKKEKEETNNRLNVLMGTMKALIKGLEEREKQIQKDHKRLAVVIEVEEMDHEIYLVERYIKSNKEYVVICHEELKTNREIKEKVLLNLTRIKGESNLTLSKGKMDKALKEKILSNQDLVIDEWLREWGRNGDQIRKTINEGESYRTRFVKEINFKLDEDKLKAQIITAIKEANIEKFKNNLISFQSMEIHFQNELQRLSKDKGKAEEAMKQWTYRASLHVIRMIDALKSMVSSMNYTNEQGYAFPLVKLKGEENLPKDETQISYLLEEYFVQAITKVLEINDDIDHIDDKALQDLMGDKVIFSKALQGRYPTLLVYKMTEKNEFKYARAREEYYTTWEAINKGEGDLPEGSGGQTLSVNTFVIMMIMSFKKKHIGNENPSTILILDNPFGKASAKHVLDPIFEIANKLNFQLICFAAPEIIKIEISERFPIFWELKIKEGKIVHGGRVINDENK